MPQRGQRSVTIRIKINTRAVGTKGKSVSTENLFPEGKFAAL